MSHSDNYSVAHAAFQHFRDSILDTAQDINTSAIKFAMLTVMLDAAREGKLFKYFEFDEIERMASQFPSFARMLADPNIS